MSNLSPIAFHGDTIYCVTYNNEPYAPVKPIIENMGLDWKTQYRKITNENRWGMVIMTIPLTTEKNTQETCCMPVRKLPAFLATINPKKVKAELREKIELYQNECDNALWDYWTKGEAKRNQQQLPQTSALSTAADRKEIFNLVGKWAKQKGLFHKDCWKAIHKEFALHSISELPKDKIQDVCNFIAAQMGENLAPAVCEKSLPAPKPELTFLPVTPKQPNVWIDYELAVYEKFHAEKLINQYHFKDYAYNARLLSWKANALFNEYEAKIKDLMKDYDMLAKPVYKAMLSKVMDQPYDSLDNTAYETDAERNRHNDCAEFTSQMWGTLNRVRNELTYRRDTLRNEVQDSIRTLVSIAKLLDM